MARSKTGALLALLAVACLLTGSHAAAGNGTDALGKGAAKSAANAHVGATLSSVQDHVDATGKALDAGVNGAITHVTNATAGANPAIAAVGAALGSKVDSAQAAAGAAHGKVDGLKASVGNSTAEQHAKAAQLGDRAADAINKAATNLSEKVAPIKAKVGSKVTPALSKVDANVHARVASAQASVAKVVSQLEKVVMPIRNHIANETAPAKATLGNATAGIYRTARTAIWTSQAAAARASAPLAPITDQVNRATSIGMSAALVGLRDGVVATVGVIDKFSAKMAPTEKAIHNVTDPIKATITGARDTARESFDNVTAPVHELRQKMFPEIRTPRLSEVFRTLFDDLPQPTDIDRAVDPPREYDPIMPKVAPPSGTCKPFEVPAPYKNLNEFCDSLHHKPKEYFAELYSRSIPKKGDEFPMTGCVFGCIVGNDTYTELQREFSLGFGWSGKCFTEERINGMPARFGSTLNRNYSLPTGFSQRERARTYKGVGEFVFNGGGAFVDQSIFDGKPVWQYYDERPEPRMMAAGGWRSLYTLFQAVGDGVTDEFRHLAPGVMIGKSFYSGPQGLMPQKWRTPRDTNYFMLFQSCTADGKIAWDPEDREVPLVGAP
ncbi:hypothetical protein Rsub_00696 [Raphidocelis subcapitata]|uniref:Uncharacterized protein n=1 Tax=Raphidocelis subcapitata TaxID=307507 RepID=A0A2V0NKU7_9CHLO|nr:hypothetical protein Rsub_00696 [Raphidocelis subcapitata]|eukprot:GBF87984.1 hypothetical protein Rsub_00696 [Raphidocelis subcapitata]